MTLNQKCAKALKAAQSAAATPGATWIDVHNAVLGIGGACATLFPERSDRVAFMKSDVFEEIRELIDWLRTERGDPPSLDSVLTARANGNISVRMPAALHAALLAEAKAEGVSLNQLCLSKLAVQLRALV